MTVHRIGVDIDGTITADPDFFAEAARTWIDAGRELHIVSSRSRDARPETLLELNQLGVSFTALYLLANISAAPSLCPHTQLNWYRSHLWLKVDYVLAHSVTHFVDDDPMVLGLFARYAPQVTALSFDDRHQVPEPSHGPIYQSR